MSRPKFLADHDLTEAIVLGVIRREPSIEFRRLREAGLANRSDAQVLEYAARRKFLVVSHDVNTMTAHAVAHCHCSGDEKGLTYGWRVPGPSIRSNCTDD